MGEGRSPQERAPGARRLVLLGAPNSGKGTQAAVVAERLGVPAISTGDMLRGAVAAGSELGRRVKGVMDAGGLVDDALMAEVVADRLRQPDARRGFLLDGYPRTLRQAQDCERMLGELGGRLDAVVLLEVPEEALMKRALGRGRADDRAEVVRERLRVYREATEPLVGYYRGRGLLRTVDGDQSIETVTASVLRALEAVRGVA